MVIALHWLHVLFAVFWFGSQYYTAFSLGHEIRRLEPEAQTALLTGMRNGRARLITIVTATATVALGIIRGYAGGALDQLDTAYGRTYLAALVVGVVMVGWVYTRGYGTKGLSWLYNSSFAVMFTLMVAMRFGY